MERMRTWHFFPLLLCTPALTSCGSDPLPDTTARFLQQPDVYTSVGGVLHLRVEASARDGLINDRPYALMRVYETSVVDARGTKVEGDASAYVGAQWHVQPGDRLIIDYVNSLPDYEFVPIGVVPDDDDENRCSAYLTGQPLNLHTHGLTVSPAGNADNVLLSIPPKRSNRYVIDIPTTQHHGLYWYHPHIHGLADTQVYDGLAGHIVVGRADGDYQEFDGLPIVPMMLRYNVEEPGQSKCDKGTLVDAAATEYHGTALTSDGGPMLYTVNGRVSPRVHLNAADPAQGLPPESQVWALSNITGSASYIVAFDEVDSAQASDVGVKGAARDIVIVSVDGSPMKTPLVLTGDQAKNGYHLPQGGRVALLVQGASAPDKVVRMIQVQNRSGSGDKSAFYWDKNASNCGFRDYTRDILAVGVSDFTRTTKHVDTPAVLTTSYEVHQQRVEGEPVVHRTLAFGSVLPPTMDAPNDYPVDDALFPNNRVIQPRAETVEQWKILNHSSLLHPFHFHTQYGEVERVTAPRNTDPGFDPANSSQCTEVTYRGKTPYEPLQYVVDLNVNARTGFTQDVVELPQALVDNAGNPVLQPDGVSAVEPGEVVMRLGFLPYLGTYVEHCHRLPHEDRGMMSLVRTIPARPVVAVAAGGTPGGADATVKVVDPGDPDAEKPSSPLVVATLTPFAGWKGGFSTAVGDVDGDATPDVAVAAGTGQATRVVVYAGASGYQKTIFSVDLPATSGPSVALSDLTGDHRDEIILGEGSGGQSRVIIHDGETGELFDAFAPYASFQGAVRVAAGMVEEGGRNSLFTAPGAGRAAEVQMYNYDLLGDATGVEFPDLHPISADRRHLVATFDGAEDSAYQGGLAIAIGYPRARLGGFANLVTSKLSGPAQVRLFALQAHDHGGGMVTSSGAHKAFVYSADAMRTQTRVALTNLSAPAPGPGLEAGAEIGLSSTVLGAELLTAAPAGGPVWRWTMNSDGTAFTEGKPLADPSGALAGSSISGI
ncbi:multicopper oxidase domain-containing protein [Polyangium aurulentum]|uniref:multicopper oxidase domain-containing protein n=1 Tax=Polyangium aurulentum TaxID=2567896 RepID=UPI0010AE99C9|nr:multicopper oxidase domain-containing protein [Polyangium aurulentum]UQA56992.1 multicopper oxidase domain-containing protein [Polyangium aurulentum]